MPPYFQTGLTWRMLLMERMELGKWTQFWYKEHRYYFMELVLYMQLQL